MCTVFYLIEDTGLKKKKIYREGFPDPKFLLSNRQKPGQANLAQRIPQVGRPEVPPWCQAASVKPWKAEARAHWAHEDKERRKAREGGGVLPTSVVAWGHWISPSRQHLRGVSQAANTSEAGCWPAPAAQQLCRSQLSRTGLYTLHRYRPLLTRSRPGALKNAPHKDRPHVGSGGYPAAERWKASVIHLGLHAKNIPLHWLCKAGSHQGLPTPVYLGLLSITS